MTKDRKDEIRVRNTRFLRTIAQVDVTKPVLAETMGATVPEAGLVLSGERSPTRKQFARLCARFPQLREAWPERFSRALTQESGPRRKFHGTPASFGEELTRAREFYRLSQAEVGAVVGVQQAAVSSWERDAVPPRGGSRGALERLFPTLRRWSDDAQKQVTADGHSPVHFDDNVSKAINGLLDASASDDLVERVIAAYKSVRGGDWDVLVSASGGSYKVSVELCGNRVERNVEGAEEVTAATVREACARLLAGLDFEIDKKIAELNALRPRVS